LLKKPLNERLFLYDAQPVSRRRLAMLLSAKFILVLAFISGAICVALGAFGAHGLQAMLSESALRTYKTAVYYQFWHSLFLLGLGLCALLLPAGEFWWRLAGTLACLGLVLFCGSLYGLALGGPRVLGPITPIGGVAFIAAWLSAAVGAFKL
jgi:uncharacterized membrane protein YgdD (TMEM256/DUF423 family)